MFCGGLPSETQYSLSKKRKHKVVRILKLAKLHKRFISVILRDTSVTLTVGFELTLDNLDRLAVWSRADLWSLLVAAELSLRADVLFVRPVRVHVLSLLFSWRRRIALE